MTEGADGALVGEDIAAKKVRRRKRKGSDRGGIRISEIGALFALVIGYQIGGCQDMSWHPGDGGKVAGDIRDPARFKYAVKVCGRGWIPGVEKEGGDVAG